MLTIVLFYSLLLLPFITPFYYFLLLLPILLPLSQKVFIHEHSWTFMDIHVKTIKTIFSD